MKKEIFVLRVLLLIGVCIAQLSKDALAQGWLQKQDIPDGSFAGRWGAYCFSVNDKIYVGGGYVGNFISKNDLWEYDVVSDSWTQRQSLPGSTNRTAAVAFSINGKGYVGLGAQDFNTINTVFLNDLWEYDPVNDSWSQRASIPDSARMKSSCFVINDKVYIVGGLTGYPELASNDLWMYDPSSDQWTSKQPYPAQYIYNSMSFAIVNKGYTVGGRVKTLTSPASTTSKETWQYDPVNNNWIDKSDFCDTLGRESGVSFVLNNKAFVGLGMSVTPSTTYYFKEFCVYDTVSGWMPSANFGGIDRAYGIATTANNKAYAGAGFLFSTAQNYFDDWYEFDQSLTGFSMSMNPDDIKIYPNPVSDILHIKMGNINRDILTYKVINFQGHYVSSGIISSEGIINLGDLPEGPYIMQISSETKLLSQKLILSR